MPVLDSGARDRDVNAVPAARRLPRPSISRRRRATSPATGAKYARLVAEQDAIFSACFDRYEEVAFVLAVVSSVTTTTHIPRRLRSPRHGCRRISSPRTAERYMSRSVVTAPRVSRRMTSASRAEPRRLVVAQLRIATARGVAYAARTPHRPFCGEPFLSSCNNERCAEAPHWSASSSAVSVSLSCRSGASNSGPTMRQGLSGNATCTSTVGFVAVIVSVFDIITAPPAHRRYLTVRLLQCPRSSGIHIRPTDRKAEASIHPRRATSGRGWVFAAFAITATGQYEMCPSSTRSVRKTRCHGFSAIAAQPFKPAHGMCPGGATLRTAWIPYVFSDTGGAVTHPVFRQVRGRAPSNSKQSLGRSDRTIGASAAGVAPQPL